MPEHTPPTANWRRWLPFTLWLLFVGGVIACADRGTMRAMFAFIARHPGADKAGHIFLIGTLALLLNYALLGRVVWRVQLGGLIVGVAITLEEISQIRIPTRHFDFGDLTANYVGICCAGWLVRRWLR